MDDIEAKGWHLSTGFVGVGYLCPVLTEFGHNEVAYRLLLNETFPSWGYSIKHGATTIWERWDGWTADKGFQDASMNSFNHYSLGSVGEWLQRHVAGLDTDPDQPGFARARLRPHPSRRLGRVRASFDSLHGRFSSAWEWRGDDFHWAVSVPANTSATVWVPTDDPASVREGAGRAAEAEGLRFLEYKEGRAVFEAGAGDYEFTAPEGVGGRAPAPSSTPVDTGLNPRAKKQLPTFTSQDSSPAQAGACKEHGGSAPCPYGRSPDAETHEDNP